MRRCAIRPITYGPRRVGLPAAVLAAAAFLGCGGGPDDGLNRQYVQGKVTLDGAPLAKGSITFDPAEGQAGGVSSGAPIIDGAYTIPRESGPTPGKYKVSIRSADAGDGASEKAAPGMPPKKPKGDPIPKQYNSASTLTAEVASSGTTTADFPLTTK